MDNDNYTYELEQALTRLLDFFEPDISGQNYIVYNDEDEPFQVGYELAQTIDHANDVLYGEAIDD